MILNQYSWKLYFIEYGLKWQRKSYAITWQVIRLSSIWRYAKDYAVKKDEISNEADLILNQIRIASSANKR